MVNRIWAVVVTYNPSPTDLCALLSALVAQVEYVILVDNASASDIHDLVSAIRSDKIEVIALAENLGLSAAQNIGLQRARSGGVDFTILFDQDSIPESRLVEILWENLHKLQRDGKRVAAVGPDFSATGNYPFRRFQGVAIRRCPCVSGNEIVSVDFLISSGCLISMEALSEIGTMNESLFIEYIDVDWGVRAKLAGFELYGVCSAKMKHSIGDKSMSTLGRTAPIHSPLRHYYLFRNAVWLCRQPNIPIRWRTAIALNAGIKFAFFMLRVPPRLQRLKMTVLGVKHGFAGKLGRLKNPEFSFGGHRT